MRCLRSVDAAGAKSDRNGRLEEAMINLIQNQAAFLTRMAEMDRLSYERFSRIEQILFEHSRILAELLQSMERLPEAVREKIAFKAP
jgi:hypothetical protein